MADEIAITQKMFNGDDYDTLYPKCVGQQVLIHDNDLASDLGVTNNGTMNDGLRALLNLAGMGANKANVEYGTYTGDGNTTKTLTFTHIPRILFVCRTDVTTIPFEIVSPDSASWGFSNQFIGVNPLSPVVSVITGVSGVGGTEYVNELSWNNTLKRVSWTTNHATRSFNQNNATYMFMAITQD